MKDLIGNWDFLIGEEFYKPYMQKIAEEFKKAGASLFDSVYPSKDEKDVFNLYKKMDISTVSVLYIVDSIKYDIQPILFEIEKVFGLNIGLTIKQDLEWLEEQGVMIFPRTLTCGDIGVHDFWNTFTDEVLIKLLGWNGNIIVMTDSSPVKIMLSELNPMINVLSCSDWQYINDKTNIELDERVIRN